MYDQMNRPMPVCASDPDIRDENLGWDVGVLVDGTPYIAELWHIDGEPSLTVIIPFLEKLLPDWHGITLAEIVRLESDEDDKTITAYSASVLTDGMECLDDFSTTEQIKAHVQYLCNMGLIEFTSAIENGGIQVLRDLSGCPVVAIHIALVMNGDVVARTPIHFEVFPQNEEKEAI